MPSFASASFTSSASRPSPTRHRMKFAADGYGSRNGHAARTSNRLSRSLTSFSLTSFRYPGLLSAASAATSAATETLYGCLARHRYSTMPLGKAPYPTRMPASAARLEKVRSTIRFSLVSTSLMRELAIPENSMYASSSTTSTGSASNSSRSSSPSTEPSGLLGDVRKSSFGACFATAALMPGTSMRKPSSGPWRGTSTTTPAFTAQSNEYMPNVGGVLMTSPGSRITRISRSISSSAPHPTSSEEADTPHSSARAARSARATRGRGRCAGTSGSRAPRSPLRRETGGAEVGGRRREARGERREARGRAGLKEASRSVDG